MRPLYDRYRQIKKALATAPISKPEAKVKEINRDCSSFLPFLKPFTHFVFYLLPPHI